MSDHKGKPEVVFVAISRPDGSLAIMQFVTLLKRNPEDPGFIREPTPANIEAEIAKAGIPALYWWITDPATLPQDRTFRNAWKDDGSRKVVHDMPRARAIHMDRIREARAPKLEALDRDWMRATGQGKASEVAQIEVQRQRLRDIPQSLDLSKAQTVDELKTIWPAELA